MFLIASKKNTDKLINLGPIKLDSTGRAEITSEYDQDSIGGTNISFDKISGAALVVMNGSQVIAPLVGFNTVDIPEYKNFKILNMYINDKATQEKQNKKDINPKENNKVDYDKYEDEIEKNKDFDEHKIPSKELEELNRVEEKQNESMEDLDKKLELDKIDYMGEEKLMKDEMLLDNIINKLNEINKKSITAKELKPIIDELYKYKPIMDLDELNSIIEDLSKMKKNTPNSELQQSIDKLVLIKEKLKEKNLSEENQLYDEEKIISDETNEIDEIEKMNQEQFEKYLDEFDDEYMNRNLENNPMEKSDNYDNIDEFLDVSAHVEEDVDMERSENHVVEATIEKESYNSDINMDLDDDIIQSTIKKESDDLNDSFALREDNYNDDGIGEDEYTPYNYQEEDLRHGEYDEEHYEKIDDDDNNYPTGNVGKFFKEALKDFDKMKNFAPEIKNTKWYRVNVNDLDSILDDDDHNKYTIAYYPMISYYPYFCRYKHYVIGLKHDENGRMKYLIYGVPGIKDKYSQPLDGKTGFVIWVPIAKDSNEDIGYWLMFYDFRNSTVLIPEK